MGTCEEDAIKALGRSYTGEEGNSRCAADAGLDTRPTKYNFATGMWSDDGSTRGCERVDHYFNQHNRALYEEYCVGSPP